MSGDLPPTLADFFVGESDADRKVAQEVLARWAATTPLAPEAAARSSDVKHRLLGTLGGPERFRPFFERIQAIVDLKVAALSEVLQRIDEDEGWLVPPFPSVRYLNFAPGPKAQGTEGGLVRLAKGKPFPRHQHQGQEVACVLEGTLHLNGTVYHPGSCIECLAGSEHEFSAGPAKDLVFIVAHNGVVF